MKLFFARSLSMLLVPLGLSSTAYALDFETAYQLMLQNNGEYQSALQAHKASEYEAKSAVSRYLPSVSVSGNYGRTDERIETVDQSFDEELAGNTSSGDPSLSGINFESSSVPEQGSYNSGSASLDITQPIFDTARLNNIRRTKSQSREAYFEWLEVREDLVLRLLQSYTNVLNASDEYAILTKELADLKEHRQLTQRRHDQGLGTLTDLHESESRYELVKAEQLSAQFDRERFLRELDVLVGQKVDSVESMSTDFKPALDIAIENGVDPIIDNEVLLAEQKVKTATHELKRRKSAFSPTLNLRAQSTFNTSEFSNVSAEEDRQSNRLFLELEIPLFAGFGNVASVKSARHRLRAERATLLNTKRNVDARLKNNRENYQVNYSRLKAFERAYLASQKALKLREKAFLEGISSNLDLLDAVRSTYRAERSWRDALYRFINSKIALIASVREVSDADISRLNELFVGSSSSTEVPHKALQENLERAPSEVESVEPTKLAIALGLTRAWAKAWSEKDAETYLSFYSDEFDINTSDLSLEEWFERRRQNLAQKKFIRITLKDLMVFEKERQLRVSFHQHYESDTWQENNQKQLVFEKKGNDWRDAKIVQERTL